MSSVPADRKKLGVAICKPGHRLPRHGTWRCLVALLRSQHPGDPGRTRKPSLAMSRRDSSRITPVLQGQYREAAGPATGCDVASSPSRCAASERDNVLAAEAAHALGYALEMLGDHTQAAEHYEHALVIDRSHMKARRRLAMLASK